MNNLKQLGLALHTFPFTDGTSNTIVFGQTNPLPAGSGNAPGNGHGQGNAIGHNNPHNPHSH